LKFVVIPNNLHANICKRYVKKKPSDGIDTVKQDPKIICNFTDIPTKTTKNLPYYCNSFTTIVLLGAGVVQQFLVS
jgi:hypothetical protein